MSWQVLGWFLASSVGAAALFASLATYGSYSDAKGALISTAGFSQIASQRAGTISRILVKDGQHVKAGDPLAIITIATVSGDAALEARRAEAIAAEQRAINARLPAMDQSSQARIAGLQSQISAEAATQASLSEQIVQQNALIKGASDDLERVRDVASRGFISARDIRQREDLVATRRQDLSRLHQELAASRSRSATYNSDISRERKELALRQSESTAASASLGRVAAADENATSITLTAPAAGVVTGVGVYAGETTEAGKAIMYVIPAGGQLQASLTVPASRVAAIAPGQPVRVAVDAYPYQTFGTLSGRVQTLSSAALPAKDPSSEAVFTLKVALDAQAITAYGKPQALRPGMTVTARVRTRSRTLAEWMLDPLYAVARR